MNDQQISDLPLNGRNYIDLSLQQAGISQNKNNGQFGGMIGTVFSSNGAPTISNNFLLDGTSLVNQTGWGTASMAGTTLGLDGIQEYKVVTNAFGAEYGMTMGSQILMVSKSGTNEFHGTAFDYFRNSDLDARNFFDPRQIPAFHRNDFGGAIGGPIRKNRTFFFGDYEGLKQIQGFTVGDVVPGAGCHGPAGAIIWNGVGATTRGCTARNMSATGDESRGGRNQFRDHQPGHRSAAGALSQSHKSGQQWLYISHQQQHTREFRTGTGRSGVFSKRYVLRSCYGRCRQCG